MNRRLISTGVALFLIASIPALCSAESHPSTRQGWLLGFGFGGGSAGFSGGGPSTDREAGAAGSFRVGYALQPEMSLELYSNGWAKEMSSVTYTLSTVTAAVNYFPGASGLALRAGIGFGGSTAGSTSGNTTTTTSDTGFGLTVGAGYEFRVTRTFAIGPQVDYGWMTLDALDADYVNLCLGITWYFIPKS
jgi:hypothetical protein